MQLYEALKKNLFFCNWPDTCINNLIKDSFQIKYAPNQVIYCENDMTTDMYFIINGKVRTYKTSADGRELNYCLYNSGDIFGYISFIDGEMRECNTESVTQSEILKIPKIAFLKILDQLTFENFFTINKFMARQLRLSKTHVISRHGNGYTLKMKLLDLLETSQDKPLVHITQAELGAHVGLSRTMLSKLLAAWEKNGSIVKQNRCILIHKEKLLEEKCI